MIAFVQCKGVEGELTKHICDVCHKVIIKGFTDDEGDFHTCEECFPKDMDRRYGKGNWREKKNMVKAPRNESSPFGSLLGTIYGTSSDDSYYEYKDKNGKWHDEPSYYTEWWE